MDLAKDGLSSGIMKRIEINVENLPLGDVKETAIDSALQTNVNPFVYFKRNLLSGNIINKYSEHI